MSYKNFHLNPNLNQSDDGNRQQVEFFGPGGGAAPPYLITPPPLQYQESHQAEQHIINQCLFQNTFVRLKNGHGFWFFPTSVEKDFVNGYRWEGTAWFLSMVHPRDIATFSCA